MQIDESSFLQPGNVYTRKAVMRATSREAAGKVVDPRAITILRRALVFMPRGSGFCQLAPPAPIRDCLARRRRD